MKSSKSILEISRELTDSIIDNKLIDLRKEHTYMFVVSRFVAQKEHIIKKSSKKNYNILSLVDEKYLPIIYFMYDTFCDVNVLDNRNIIYLNGLELDNNSKHYKAIWFFSKIRDAFCHGKYSFDTNEEVIVIDNNEFGIKCKIPVTVFDYVSFYIREIDSDRDKTFKEIEEKYKCNLELERLSGVYKNIDKEEAKSFAHKINLKLKELNKELGLQKCHKTLSGGSSSRDDEEEIDYYEVAKDLLNLIEESSLERAEKDEYIAKIYKCMKKRNDIDKLFTIIIEIEEVLKIGTKQTVLYNHSSILFNNLPISSFTVSNTGRMSFRYDSSHPCELLKNKISELCNFFINKNKIFMNSVYYNNDEEKFKKHLDQSKKSFIDILRMLEQMLFLDENSYSKCFASSVRNGIFHSNIDGVGSNITISNRSDNISGSDDKFILSGNVYDYNMYLRSLERPNNKIILIDILLFTSKEFEKTIFNYYEFVTGKCLSFDKTIDEIENELNYSKK